jgi:adenosylmethionine-8-amino-7-oxononanoate aminotransferase
MIIQPEGYLARLAEICRAHDVLFIADEVATGFGRTGRMFACELEGVEPDIMSLGKGISGGALPLAATMANRRVYEGSLGEYAEFKTFFHGHTYTGNPLACAAALASLELMEENRVIESLPPKVDRLAQGLAPVADQPHVMEVRQQGLMVGVELGRDKDTPYPPEARMGHRAIMACRPHGVIVRPLGDTVILMPPLSSTLEELELLTTAVGRGIAQATEG